MVTDFHVNLEWKVWLLFCFVFRVESLVTEFQDNLEWKIWLERKVWLVRAESLVTEFHDHSEQEVWVPSFMII